MYPSKFEYRPSCICMKPNLETVERALQPPSASWSVGASATEDGRGLNLRLAWPALPHGVGGSGPSAAVPRLRRRRGAARRHQLWHHRCAGADAAPPAAAEPPPGPFVRAELSARQQQFEEALEPEPTLLPAYALATVSAFGIESRGDLRVAQRQVQGLAPISDLTAAPLATLYTAAAFYRDADAVQLNWQRSPTDLAHDPGSGGSDQPPLLAGVVPVQRYRVWRRIGAEAEQRVADRPAGRPDFVDHPGAEALLAGVRHRVEALDAGGTGVSPPEACAWTEAVQLDLCAPLRWAAAGAGYLQQPTAFERQQLAILADPAALAAARARFAAAPEPSQRSILQAFWQHASLERRSLWRQQQPRLLSSAQRAQWLASAATQLPASATLSGQLGSWLSELPNLQAEADGSWALLDAPSQELARRQWLAHQPPAYAQWLTQHLQGASPAVVSELEQPLRQGRWWAGLDPEEGERLQRWWGELTAPERDRRLQAWFGALPEPAQEGLAWPEWAGRPEAQRAELLASVPDPLPEAFWPGVLAWQAWHDLDEDARVQAIQAEVGLWGRSLSAMHYAIRPLDAALYFRLQLALLLLSMGVLIAVLMRQTSRDDPDPADDAD